MVKLLGRPAEEEETIVQETPDVMLLGREAEPEEISDRRSKVRKAMDLSREIPARGVKAAGRGALSGLESILGLVQMPFHIAEALGGPKTAQLASVLSGGAPTQEAVRGGEKLFETLRKPLEVEDPTFAERTIERGASYLPFLFGGGIPAALGRTLGRTALAALAGETVKAMGVGPLGEAVAEVGALGVPGLAKRIIPTKKTTDLLKAGRALGMTEKELAPFVAGKGRRFLGQALGTGARIPEHAQKGVKRAYETLKKAPGEIKPEGPLYKKFPPAQQKDVFKLIGSVMEEPLTTGKLQELWVRTQKIIPSNLRKEWGSELSNFKNILRRYVGEASPDHLKQWKNLDKMYSAIKTFEKEPIPKNIMTAIKTAKAGTIFLPLLKGISGLLGVGKALAIHGTLGMASKQLMENPRLQNLFGQTLKAVKQNKKIMTLKLLEKLNKELKREGIDTEDFEEKE